MIKKKNMICFQGNHDEEMNCDRVPQQPVLYDLKHVAKSRHHIVVLDVFYKFMSS